MERWKRRYLSLSHGNCFWGDGAEERCREYQTALHTQGRIRKLGGRVGIPDCDEWFELYYNKYSNCIEESFSRDIKPAYFYFESKEIAERVLKELGQELIIRMVKNGVAL